MGEIGLIVTTTGAFLTGLRSRSKGNTNINRITHNPFSDVEIFSLKGPQGLSRTMFQSAAPSYCCVVPILIQACVFFMCFQEGNVACRYEREEKKTFSDK